MTKQHCIGSLQRGPTMLEIFLENGADTITVWGMATTRSSIERDEAIVQLLTTKRGRDRCC